jgi:hypothetical protein
MRYTGLSGGKINTDVAEVAEKVFMLFEADDALTPGVSCVLDTGSVLGKVVAGGANGDAQFVGVYSGEGGSKPTSDAAYPGKTDAVAGDLVWVQVYGVCEAEVASSVTDGACLALGASGSFIVSTSGSTDGLAAFAIALEAGGAATEPHPIFLKAM